jgi:hypothetical protein
MTRYAKRKLKYSLYENFNLLPYVQWDRGGHIQITIMIDTQQQYINLNIRGEISIVVVQAHELVNKLISISI